MKASKAVVGFRSGREVTPDDGHNHVAKAYSASDGGNGGGTMNMEVRVAKLESDIEHIKNDVKDIKDDLREVKVDLREFQRETRAEFNEVRREARTDFRLLFGALIAVALGLAGLMAKGFQWL